MNLIMLNALRLLQTETRSFRIGVVEKSTWFASMRFGK